MKAKVRAAHRAMVVMRLRWVLLRALQVHTVISSTTEAMSLLILRLLVLLPGAFFRSCFVFVGLTLTGRSQSASSGYGGGYDYQGGYGGGYGGERRYDECISIYSPRRGRSSPNASANSYAPPQGPPPPNWGAYPSGGGTPHMPPGGAQAYGPQFQNDESGEVMQMNFQYSMCTGRKKALCVCLSYIFSHS